MELNIYKQHTETTDGRKTINEALNMLFSRAGMFVAVMLVLTLCAGAEDTKAPQIELPEGTSTDWWTAVQEDIRTSEYDVIWQEETQLSDLNAAYQAPNRAHNLRTYFAPESIRITPREFTDWVFGLSLVGYGFADDALSVSEAEMSVSENRVEYRRGCLTEWYVNREDGLEQGFTIDSPPESGSQGSEKESWIAINMDILGDLNANMNSASDVIEFTTTGGVGVLRYSKLHAFDAAGRELDARFTLSESTIGILVNASGAVYPITIDPLAQSPAWTAESNQYRAWFGWSVASAGDVNGDGYSDVIVGAYSYDNGEDNEGRAYVYHGSETGLLASSAWTAESNQYRAWFGWSVASAGDVNGDGYSDVIVGAYSYDNGEDNEGRAYVYHGSAPLPTCDICVNTSGWWRDCGTFNASGTPIQAAVDNANTGETICVRDGTYNENVDVDVAHLTIRSENGSANCIVNAVDSGYGSSIFLVYADYVNISGFTVQSDTCGSGIHLYGASNCAISDSIVLNNEYGIYLQEFSNNNVIINNTGSFNDWYTIILGNSSNNIIGCNKVSNSGVGISVSYSSNNNIISNNEVSNNDDGIYLCESCNDNIVTNNNASNNYEGIRLVSSSSNNTITGNSVSNNYYGIDLDYSSNNLIYNNYFNNTNNAYDNGNNIWNIIKTSGTNIIGGPYLGGNYWGDYIGIDADGDRLGDTILPYNSSGNIAYGGDWHPLTMAAASISGRVVCEEDGMSIEGATVKAWVWDVMPFEFVCESTTNADGIYIITNLSAGAYRVYAYAPEYGREFYNGTYFWNDAQPVSVIEGEETPNINFSLGPGGSISGTITSADSGTPLSNVSMCAKFADENHGAGAGISDENGNYMIVGLPYSTYKVLSPTYARFGSGDDNYIMELWQENATWDDADIVTVAEGINPMGINFTLEVSGTISGYVYQEDGVTPLSNVHIHANDYDTNEWMDGTNTDQDGFYSLVLPNGTYRVRACPSCNGINYVSKFYDNTFWHHEAQPVSVNAPDNTPNINFTLEPGGTISGTVRDSQGNLLAGVSVECGRIDGPGGEGAETRSDGTYTIEGLPFGTYKVSSPSGGRWGSNDNNWAQEWYYEAANGDDADGVAITSDNPDATGVDFTLEVGGTISGYVYQEDGVTPLPDVHVHAEDFDTDEWMDGTNTDQDGFYSLVLPNGTYHVCTCGFCCSELPYAGECYDGPVSVTVPDDAQNINFTLVSIVRRATIEEAIADGVAWLAAEQNPDGSWGSQYQVAKTALAVLNLETHATEIGYSSPFDPAYNYSDEIESGLNYLFSHAHIISISDQTHDGISDNPDTNGNGTGIYFRSPDLPPDHGCVDIYETSIAVMGIAASTYPARVVNVTGSAVDGWTYEDVLQDAVDYLAWAQTDSGFGRGGWNYEPMDNSGDRSDQSNSGWVTLGLAYAEAPSYGFELTIPGFVRSELDIWIDYIQNDVDGDTNDGGSDYTGPDDPDWDWNWVNVLKTGNLLQQMAFVGDTATTQRAQDAIDYIVMHWNEDNGDPGWRGCPTCYHATYTTMKGLEALNVTTIDSIDWFHEFTDALLPEQTIDGWWMVSCFDDGEGILSTEWALLTLQKRIPRITKPDLTVLEKHEEWVDEGNGTYRVFYTVKNRGNMEAPAGHNVSLTVDGAAIEQKTVPVSLAPAATYSGSFDMVLSVGQEYHEIVVCADSTGMVDELNEDNNCLVNFWPATVSIESAACSVGGTVNVPINITGASNIGAMDISVTYDASVLTATGVANGMMITSLPNVIVAHDISAGRVNISFATYPETVNGDGELFVVTFDADAAGNSTLDITVEEAWTGDVPPQPVAPVTVNGYVNVTSTTPSHDPADTNHDCVVDMMELMAHISKWKSGEVGMMELMTSIGRWKLGTGGYC